MHSLGRWMIALAVGLGMLAAAPPSANAETWGWTYAGTVTDQSGAPVAGAEVTVLGHFIWDDSEPSETRLFQTVTGSDGRYRFERPEYASSSSVSGLYVEAAGYQSFFRQSNDDGDADVSLSEGEPGFAPGSVTVRVFGPDGAPLEGAALSSKDPYFGLEPSDIIATTDAAGQHTFTYDVDPASLDPSFPIYVSFDGSYQHVGYLTTWVPGWSREIEYRFPMSPEAFPGRLTWADGGPAAATNLMFDSDIMRVRNHAYVADDGAFRITTPGGDYVVYARIDSVPGEPEQSPLYLPLGDAELVSVTSPIDLQVPHLVTVSGRVVNEAGDPVRGHVSLGEVGLSYPQGAQTGTSSDASGRFSLKVPAGTYEAVGYTVGPYLGGIPREIDVADDIADVELVIPGAQPAVERGTLDLRLVDVVEGATVTVTHDVGGATLTATVDANGAATFTDIPVGTYLVEVRHRLFRTWGESVAVLAGELTAVRPQLAAIRPPNRPTLSRARPSSPTRAKVTFTPSAGGDAAKSFVATCSRPGDTGKRSASDVASPMSVTDLRPGTLYHCRVRARNVAGTSPWSAWSPWFTTPRR